MTTKEGGLRGSIRNVGVGVSEIPDSAVLRWPFSEGGGSTAAETIETYGDQDGTLSETGIWTSGTWVNGFAVSGDGVDNTIRTGTWGSWGSNRTSDFWVAFTIQTTSSGTDEAILGATDDTGNSTQLFSVGTGLESSFAATNGSRIDLVLRDNDGDYLIIESDQDIDDGSKYRVVINKTANSGNAADMFINGSETSTSTIEDQGDGITDVTDFAYDIGILARHNGSGNFSRHSPATVDDLLIGDPGTTLSTNEITSDYDRQPWSP